VREARVSYNRGGPENPLSNEELEVKFYENAERALPEEQVEELRATLNALNESGAVEDVVRLVRSGS
jgi:2-methylcitrate dehydratase PrpD